MLLAEQLWASAYSRLESQMTQISFNSWVKGLRAVNITDNKLVLEAPNEYSRNTLNKLYKNTILSAVQQAGNSNYCVEFICPGELERYADDDTKQYIPATKNGLNPKYTFDTFIVGSSNRFAHAGALAVARTPAQTYNPLFLYGGVGLGKTHLMHAIGHHICQQHAQMNILYVTSETFTNDLIDSIQNNKNAEFRERYRSIDVLLIDDIQFLASKERTQEEFFHTFNTLHSANKQIIISSDKPPKDMKTLEERLRSRFEWGLIADIQAPDIETRIAILRNKAKLEGIAVDDEVTLFIATAVESNIRELEGALTRVMAYSMLTSQPITFDLAQEALKDVLAGTRNKQISAPLIKEVVASYYSVSVDDLSAKRRDRSISYPRQVAMYLIRTLTPASLPQIGEMFGGRDHTTVLHGYEKIHEEISKKPELKTEIDDIIRRIRE